MPMESRNDAEKQPLVLITGVSGLIGQRIAETLKGEFRLVGLDVKPPAHAQHIHFFSCDLTDAENVRATLRQVQQQHGRQLASVIHLAAYYDFTGEPSDLYEKLTVNGTKHLMSAVRELFDAEQFLFSSSLLVMRAAEVGGIITEESPLDPTWDYPASKIRAEDVLRNERGDVSVLILRIAGVYDEDGHSLPLSQHIRRIYEKQLESYLFPGDKHHGQPFIHLDDLTSAVRQAIRRREQLPPFEILLLAEPDVVTYQDLQDLFGEHLHGHEWTTIRIPKVVAKTGAWVKDSLASVDDPVFIKPWMVDFADAHYPVSIERARRQLQWEPKHRLRNTIPEMIRRLKQDPRAWYQRHGLPFRE